MVMCIDEIFFLIYRVGFSVGLLCLKMHLTFTSSLIISSLPFSPSGTSTSWIWTPLVDPLSPPSIFSLSLFVLIYSEQKLEIFAVMYFYF